MPRLTPEQRDELRRARYNSLMAKVADHAAELEEQWLLGELPGRQARHGQMEPPPPGFTPRPSVEHAGTPIAAEELSSIVRENLATRPAHPDPQPAPVAAATAAVDYAAMAMSLRVARKSTQASLVEYMASRTEATAEDIVRHVLDDPVATDSAVRKLAQRTTESLAALDSRVVFRFAGGRVIKLTSKS